MAIFLCLYGTHELNASETNTKSSIHHTRELNGLIEQYATDSLITYGGRPFLRLQYFRTPLQLMGGEQATNPDECPDDGCIILKEVLI